ncbi:MAG: class I SAM-dependent methyltransferase [Defluviitaleaceae bacterium]|nr:class I SAM-dependent methyltransferase [Defluviitaleaceae bacterium]
MSYLIDHYSNYDEDARLGYKHGQVEFLTTMRYIEKYLIQDAHVLEVGAGTGRYSRTIADMGYKVEAVELIQHNIEIFRKQITSTQKINITQGNALDLGMFENNTFDMTLVFGPMYHLYTEADKHQAISEALRVTKRGGVIFVAYCIGDASILEDAFHRMKGSWVSEGLNNGKINPETFAITSQPQDIFELTRKEDIDRLMASFQVERLHYVATDMISRFLRESLSTMDDETFNLYLKYHYAVCERPDMVGLTHHSLDIFKKE